MKPGVQHLGPADWLVRRTFADPSTPFPLFKPALPAVKPEYL